MGFDLGRAIADAMDQMRRSGDRGATLEAMGLRNAIVVLNSEGRQTTWRVPSLDVDLTHKQKRRSISGTVRIASAGEPWRLGFRIEASEKQQAISVTTEIGGLVPSALAGSLPGLGILDAFNVPILRVSVVIEATRLVPRGGEPTMPPPASSAAAIRSSVQNPALTRAHPRSLSLFLFRRTGRKLFRESDRSHDPFRPTERYPHRRPSGSPALSRHDGR